MSTSSSTRLQLRVWDGTQPNEVPLAISKPPDTCTVGLRCLPGASGIHVVLRDARGVRLRGELTAYPGEVVSLQIGLDEQGAPHVSSRGNLLLLPGDARYEPPPPIAPASPSAPIDIAIVIDGTLRDWEAGGRLLEVKERWAAHVDKLITFVERVAQGREARGALIVFGDQIPPSVTADDLTPDYMLSEPQALQPLDFAELKDSLFAIRATPGGDFVDALADALQACRWLRWNDARKLVVVSGDSPGFSLLHPLPKGADLSVRELDVDTQAFHLYRLGVELMTIYHAPPAERALDAVARSGPLLKAASKQYQRLASLPDLAFEAATFGPDLAAEQVAKIRGYVGRGAALGELLSPTPDGP